LPPTDPEIAANFIGTRVALGKGMDMRSTVSAFAYDTLGVPEAQGARMHWCELTGRGVPQQPPLLLLHGLHDSHLTWQRIAPALAEGRRVLMPDLFGCGLSDRPDASYALRWHAGTVARWLQGIGVDEVDVVGHSYGGGVAQMLLLEPEIRVRRLALLASGGLGRDVGVWLRLAALPFVEHLGQPFMAHGTRLALRYLHPSRSPEEIERLSEMNAREHTARAFARTVRDVVDWHGQRRAFLQHAHEFAALPPLAVYWGDRDEIIPMSHGLAFARSVQGVRFHCVSNAGHWLHDDQPREVAKLLQSFLAPRVQRSTSRQNTFGAITPMPARHISSSVSSPSLTSTGSGRPCWSSAERSAGLSRVLS
jgi:pimeloyl-ACP methyl ester carboxylesterase